MARSLFSAPVPLHLPEPRIDPGAFVAPGAHVYGDVTIRAGVFVLFGVVIRAELDRVEIGAGTNIQDNSVVHCDEDVPCVIGAAGDGGPFGCGSRSPGR